MIAKVLLRAGLAVALILVMSFAVVAPPERCPSVTAPELRRSAQAGVDWFVRNQDREFFIAYARTLRRKVSEDALRKQVASSDHAPEEYRADAVRNLDAWYAAFDVRPGQRLYLEPSARVRIW